MRKGKVELNLLGGKRGSTSSTWEGAYALAKL